MNGVDVCRFLRPSDRRSSLSRRVAGPAVGIFLVTIHVGCSLLYPAELQPEDAAADVEAGDGDEGGDADVSLSCGNGRLDPGEICDTAIAPRPCDPGCGSAGTERCTGCTSLECHAPAESCNGEDDDCDGSTDEGYPCIAGADVACTTPCGLAGVAPCLDTCELPSGRLHVVGRVMQRVRRRGTDDR